MTILSMKNDIIALVVANSLIFHGVDALLEDSVAADDHIADVDDVHASRQKLIHGFTKESADITNHVHKHDDVKPWERSNAINFESFVTQGRQAQNPVSQPQASSSSFDGQDPSQLVDAGRLRSSAVVDSTAVAFGADASHPDAQDEAATRDLKSSKSARSKLAKDSKSGASGESGKSAKSPDLGKASKSVKASELCFTGTAAGVTAACASANANCCVTPDGASRDACGWASHRHVRVCANSCNGDGACMLGTDATTNIGFGFVSCNGEDACASSVGYVENNSCNGERACDRNIGHIAKGSCIGEDACASNKGDIDPRSCIGISACVYNYESVGTGSCLGERACTFSYRAVGDNSCVGPSACEESLGVITDGACKGADACNSNFGLIKPYSCIGDNACRSNSADVGEESCLGYRACFSTSSATEIGDNSCVGTSACETTSDEIGDGECIGDNVCKGNP
eukprot:CAMPEP_0198135042 /NCGR_PEP_ID=MMETSP1442-20131203/60385_1 /TAXON_ID= /ORGANISM="Craspedostauros australis, Strain CCMP3328" /LENGTH=457 /DNA_ID=CAMNT_0043796201 /DNA_START=67 /DNA_END=1443 /DNA_ORIENTATION=+